jgi:hypothetical protein
MDLTHHFFSENRGPPNHRELRDAQDLFDALLRTETSEAQWQTFFAKNPFTLSRSLPLKLAPCDILPLGRPGRSEPDFVLFPGSPNSLPIHGLVELKTNYARILSNPRRKILKLSESASTAVAQVRSYDQKYDEFSPVPRALSLSGRSHLFVIIGMRHELEKLGGALGSELSPKLLEDVRLLTFDELAENFNRTLPSVTSILVPNWIGGLTTFQGLSSRIANPNIPPEDHRLFESLLRDNLFLKQFIAEFRTSALAQHARYDLGSAAPRFFGRRVFGNMLAEYGLGRVETNVFESDLDIYLDLELSPKGSVLRDIILNAVPDHQLDEVAKRGWYFEDD